MNQKIKNIENKTVLIYLIKALPLLIGLPYLFMYVLEDDLAFQLYIIIGILSAIILLKIVLRKYENKAGLGLKILSVVFKIFILFIICFFALVTWDSKGYKNYRFHEIKELNGYKEFVSHKFIQGEGLYIKNISFFIDLQNNKIHFIKERLPKTNEIEKQIKDIEFELNALERIRVNPQNFFNESYNIRKYAKINNLRSFEKIPGFNEFLKTYNKYGSSFESKMAFVSFLKVYVKKLNKRIEKISMSQMQKIGTQVSSSSIYLYPQYYSVDSNFAQINKIKLRDIFYGAKNDYLLNIYKIKYNNKKTSLLTDFIVSSKYKDINDKHRFFMYFYVGVILLLLVLIIKEIKEK